MITKLTIRNFKAISNLSIKLTPLTILIGENSCGKSTVLQALDFLCSAVSRDIGEYLNDREWEFDDIRSQFASKDDSISFEAEIDIDGKNLFWEISINNDGGKKWLVRERIADKNTRKLYLSFGMEKEDGYPNNFSSFNIQSSVLKILNTDRQNSEKGPFDDVLFKLKLFLTSSSSFELLSPDRMRSKGSRGQANDIGMGGERLAAFIHGMTVSQKNDLSKIVSEFVGYDVKVTTAKNRSFGWVEMYLEEVWGKEGVKVKKRYISDGLLRIIAFSAILVNQDSKPVERGVTKGLILLDEIEDGIHPSLSESVVNKFKEAALKFRKQVIITSHSPVMVNFSDIHGIQFMWRDSKGKVYAKPLFQTKEMRETLDFLNPGEVWLNYTKDDIIKRLSTADGAGAAHD
ncbi:MAG: AAA family ATPase [Chitinispirillales bacterium]|nr:AAA family ATPase [Chitinispirillales bacterium]